MFIVEGIFLVGWFCGFMFVVVRIGCFCFVLSVVIVFVMFFF